MIIPPRRRDRQRPQRELAIVLEAEEADDGLHLLGEEREDEVEETVAWRERQRVSEWANQTVNKLKTEQIKGETNQRRNESKKEEIIEERGGSSDLLKREKQPGNGGKGEKDRDEMRRDETRRDE